MSWGDRDGSEMGRFLGVILIVFMLVFLLWWVLEYVLRFPWPTDFAILSNSVLVSFLLIAAMGVIGA